VLPLEDGTMVTPLNRDQFAALVKTAEATAIRLARAIETAEVPATPGDHCRQCVYSDICRTTLINGHDGERQEAV
jgi:CRISPR/Cas system-associated exonuclease Cas4 (RecB family)